jgi:hypothetical protein
MREELGEDTTDMEEAMLAETNEGMETSDQTDSL